MLLRFVEGPHSAQDPILLPRNECPSDQLDHFRDPKFHDQKVLQPEALIGLPILHSQEAQLVHPCSEAQADRR